MSDEPTNSSPWRRHAVVAGKLAVSLLLLAVLFTRVDTTQLWAGARKASLPWLMAALAVLLLNAVASTWRWHLLLDAQSIEYPRLRLLGSLLVANFFSNFLPSNIGGDVIRIRDTAQAARSRTLATTVILVDRGLGLLGLVLIAATGASAAASLHGSGTSPVWPSWLWAVFFVGTAVTVPAMYSPRGVAWLLRPLRFLHPEWVGGRIDAMTGALNKFRERPSAIVRCFAGAIFVQALVVAFYMTVVHALSIPIAPWDLAVIVPLSLVVQMAPVSMNGFGVREATFSFYFSRIGLPIESAILLSLVGAALTMFFSLTGAVVWFSRDR